MKGRISATRLDFVTLLRGVAYESDSENLVTDLGSECCLCSAYVIVYCVQHDN